MGDYHKAPVYSVGRGNEIDRTRHPFAVANAHNTREIHNARGLIVAVTMSAACWAAIAIAFLL